MRSWRKTLTGLLAFLLILLLGFLAWTNISYYRQSVENIRQQNIHTAELWENSVGTRLNMLYEHLYELLLTIYNNTELGAGTPMMQYSAKKKCLDMMSDKLRVSEDLFLSGRHRKLTQAFFSGKRSVKSEKICTESVFLYH